MENTELILETPPAQPPEHLEPNPANAVYAAIAAKVRTDSQNLAKPIHIEDLAALFPERTPEQIIGHLSELVKVAEYQDIKLMTSGSGATYLYSDTFVSPEEASAKSLAEETQAKIAARVREDSQVSIKLTAVESLAELAPDLPPGQIEGYVAALAGGETYQDLRSIASPTGHAYLYSETYMTDTYARMLARVEGKDPCRTIAETVREESRIYPRPTKVALFYEPIFQIAPDQLETAVELALQRPENKDLVKIVASTGAIYLYSGEYLSAPQAEFWVQWEEVDRHNNP